MKILLFFIISFVALINGQTSSVSYGNRARLGQFKFVATVYSKGSRRCNGAIIGEFYVITAAHCVYNELLVDLRVVVGTISTSPSTNWRQVQRIHVFSGYDRRDHSNDIGIIQLKDSLVYNNRIHCIDYDTVERSAAYTDCKFIRFKESASDPNVRSLWWQDVTISTHADCESIAGPQPSYIRCMSATRGPIRHTVSGDSGAPIVCNGILTAIQHARLDTTNGAPGLVVMVAAYKHWIRDTIY